MRSGRDKSLLMLYYEKIGLGTSQSMDILVRHTVLGHLGLFLQFYASNLGPVILLDDKKMGTDKHDVTFSVIVSFVIFTLWNLFSPFSL